MKPNIFLMDIPSLKPAQDFMNICKKNLSSTTKQLSIKYLSVFSLFIFKNISTLYPVRNELKEYMYWFHNYILINCLKLKASHRLQTRLLIECIYVATTLDFVDKLIQFYTTWGLCQTVGKYSILTSLRSLIILYFNITWIFFSSGMFYPCHINLIFTLAISSGKTS